MYRILGPGQQTGLRGAHLPEMNPGGPVRTSYCVCERASIGRYGGRTGGILLPAGA